MAAVEKFLTDATSLITNYLSDYILVILLVGTGIFFTIRTKFVQVRCFGEGMKKVFGNFSMRGKKQKSGMSSFQALTAAIAAQVGTGNIVGACAALLAGGPGAIFWMWVIAFLGMATIYAEATLAQKTREVQADGTVQGGPVYYIKKAFKGTFGKILAVFFSVATIIALGFMGTMVQSYAISTNFGSALNNITGANASTVGLVVGIIVVALSAVLFLGNVQRIASVTEKLVPIMAGLYLVGGLIVLIVHIRALPEAIGMIFRYAFVPQAIIGGGFGFALKEAISQGAKRGLFSNEAGMGSTPHAHALANVKNPHDQGVVAMIGVFIDTFIVLTMTALAAITVLYTEGGPLHSIIGNAQLGVDGFEFQDLAKAAGLTDSNMVQGAFSITFSKIFGVFGQGGAAFGAAFGQLFVAICLLFFAFSTIISWNMFGKINFRYLFGKKATIAYSIIALVFVFLGSIVTKSDLVWNLSDIFNQLMVFPNVLALWVLSGTVVNILKNRKNNDLLD